MPTVSYSETYTETNFNIGITRSFGRDILIDGSLKEVKELLPEVFKSMPRYNYPILKEREDFLGEAFKHLETRYYKSLEE